MNYFYGQDRGEHSKKNPKIFILEFFKPLLVTRRGLKGNVIDVVKMTLRVIYLEKNNSLYLQKITQDGIKKSKRSSVYGN